jgi:hypothetical protein
MCVMAENEVNQTKQSDENVLIHTFAIQWSLNRLVACRITACQSCLPVDSIHIENHYWQCMVSHELSTLVAIEL